MFESCGVIQNYLPPLFIVIEGKPVVFDDSVFKNLELYERPKTIRFVPKLIENESGKVKRGETIL